MKFGISGGAIITTVLILIILVVSIYVLVLLIKALRKYINSKAVRNEKNKTVKCLGELLKEYRIEHKMTQEFIAETLGVSRQAVSKWENGTSDPSTSNLMALAKLYGTTAEIMLQEIQDKTSEI